MSYNNFQVQFCRQLTAEVLQSTVSPACSNFASAVIKKLICSTVPEKSWLLIKWLTFLMTCWSMGSLAPKNTRLFSLSETFANMDILDDSASCWSISSLEQRITRLFSLCKTLANLWFVCFCSARRACEVRLRQCLIDIQRYIRFDRPPQQLLGRIAPASSFRDCASALRDGDPIAAAGSSVHVIESIILLALIVAAVGGGDIILKQRLQLRLDISAAPLRSVTDGSVAALTRSY